MNARLASLVLIPLAALFVAGCSGDSGRAVPVPASAMAPATSGTPVAGPGPVAPAPAPTQPEPLRVDGAYLRDAHGRAVLLRGMNVSNSAKRAPYLAWQTASDFDELPRWGMNAVRLLIQWRAVEPQPGQIDNVYLDAVADRVRWLADRDVWVVIDMHQDVFGGLVGGNGAPDWATLPQHAGFTTLPQGMPWFASYAKPEVMHAFDRFWVNAPAPDGVGLQDHYAAAWAAVAARFQSAPNVIGYDLMNEPYYGSDVANLVVAALAHDVTLLFNPMAATDPARLIPLLQSMAQPQADFETGKLAPFYERVRLAIRAVDPHRLVMLEPAGLANSGIPIALPRPNDSQAILYPHYYDPQTFDGQSPYDADPRRMQAALSSMQGAWPGSPLVIGELGNVAESLSGSTAHVRDLYGELDARWIGGMWWEWSQGFASRGDLHEIGRPYPRRVPGTPVSFSYDPSTRVARLEYTTGPGDTAPVMFSVPDLVYPTGFTVELSDPAGSWSQAHEATKRVVAVQHDRGTSQHTLTVRPR